MDIVTRYKECEPLLTKLARAAIRRYRLDEHDAMSSAQLSFVNACQSYRQSPGGTFQGWLVYCVRNDLQTIARHKAYRAARVKQYPLNDTDINNTYARSTPFLDLLDELPDDARTVVRLALDLPASVFKEAKRQGARPRNVRQALRMHLRFSLRWGEVRIRNAFKEIQRALQ